MVTYRQLAALDLGQLLLAADSWGDLEGSAYRDGTQVSHGARSSLVAQSGATVNAVTSRLTMLERNYQYVSEESGLVRSTLSALVDELGPVQSELKTTLSEAADRGFVVEDDGSVSYPLLDGPAPLSPSARGQVGGPAPYEAGVELDAIASPNQEIAQEIADRIAGAVAKAAEIDARFTRALGRLKAERDYAVTDATWRDVSADDADVLRTAGRDLHLGAIPSNADPQANATWWKGLSPEQQQEYAALYPSRIGAVDGLPVVVRDQANRVTLAEEHARLTAELSALGPEPIHQPFPTVHDGPNANAAWNTWTKKKTELEDHIQGLNQVQSYLDGDSDMTAGMPPTYLLGIDTKGNGHAIVARGNPDTAENTAAYVPGTTSRLSNMGRNMRRADTMWAASNQVSPSASTAAVTWLGYDAPQSLVENAPLRRYADAGAPKFDSFISGLRAAHEGARGHVTAVGHSYGTTLLGSAAIHGHLDVDDMIVAGSPGMEVTHEDQLHIPADHFWIEGGKSDPVPDMGKYLSNLPSVGWDGPTVPTDSTFGGQHMFTDTYAHGDYWDSGSTALANQAAVITGHYEKVKHGTN
jgi:Alpha/beta hydrolase